MIHILAIAAALVVYWCLDALVMPTFWATVHVGSEYIDAVMVGAAVAVAFIVELKATNKKKGS